MSPEELEKIRSQLNYKLLDVVREPAPAHEHEQRLYVLVLRTLSSMQKGIQALHAAVEFSNVFHGDLCYQRWSRQDKTVVVLDGGTSNATSQRKDTLDAYLRELTARNIPVAGFYETDLNNALTAVAFLADYRVYQKSDTTSESAHKQNAKHRVCNMSPERANNMREAVRREVGDERNVFLRTFIKQFALAS